MTRPLQSLLLCSQMALLMALVAAQEGHQRGDLYTTKGCVGVMSNGLEVLQSDQTLMRADIDLMLHQAYFPLRLQDRLVIPSRVIRRGLDGTV